LQKLEVIIAPPFIFYFISLVNHELLYVDKQKKNFEEVDNKEVNTHHKRNPMNQEVIENQDALSIYH